MFWSISPSHEEQQACLAGESVHSSAAVRTCRASRMCSLVCGMGPSVADTTRMAPSICRFTKSRGVSGLKSMQSFG